MDDAYHHLTLQPLTRTETGRPLLPLEMSPRFSLAYFRDCRDGAILLNREGRVTFINESAIAELGLGTMDAAGGRTWWGIFPDHLEAVLRDAHHRVLNCEGVRFTAALDPEAAKPHRVDVLASPVINSDGIVETVFSVVVPSGRTPRFSG